MPELPEVQAVVASLRPHVPGCTIRRVEQGRRDIASLDAFRRTPHAGLDLAPLLHGRTLVDVARRGKRIIFPLDDGAAFYVHLGMTGRLVLREGPSAVHPLPHTHLTLELHPSGASAATLALSFADPRRFGRIVFLPPGTPPDADLGPEPFDLDAASFHARLRRTRRPLKSALLDQSLLAGLGNIYADESLHLAGLHPRRRTHTLRPAESQALLRAIQGVLTAAIAAGGSTLRDYRDANGRAGTFVHQHRVYGRGGQPCVTCHTPICTISLAQRSTHFCPTCQPYRRGGTRR
ncbi:MAG: bifunctional DNA-formamidopyrimidine glycosylase/DNA-(apurinic or apyrimidinic site) lyase [Tepidisphaerales bacterium]